jgi:hypothetical protein
MVRSSKSHGFTAQREADRIFGAVRSGTRAIQVSLVHLVRMVEHEATQKQKYGGIVLHGRRQSAIRNFTRLGLESSKHGNIWAPYQRSI